MKEEIYHFYQKEENKELISTSICGITYPDRNYRILRCGSANTAVIEYVEEGTGCVNVDSETFYPCAGDSYFLQQGKSHHYYSDKQRPWKKYFINFSGKLALSLTEGYGLTGTSYFKGLSIKKELTDIIELAKRSEDDHTEQIVCILNSILIKFHAHMQSGKESSTIEEQMREFLDTKTTSRFRIEELCCKFHRSESQTIRMFKKAYGITPYAYLLEKKLSLAKKLLRDTNLSVKDIAEKLAFADEYYFSGTFKKKTGMTPSAYKKSLR